MTKALFLVQPQVGHLNSLLTIALQMKEDGWQPTFLTLGIKGNNSNIQIFKIAASVPPIIEKAGFPVKFIKPPIFPSLLATLLPYTSGYREFRLATNLATLGLEKLTTEILKHIEKEEPDVIVADFTLFAAYI